MIPCRAPVAAALVGAVLVLASCSGGGSSAAGPAASSAATTTTAPPSVAVSLPPGADSVVVATVAGVPISEAELRSELNAVGSVPAYLDDVDASLAASGAATRSAGGGFDPEFVRNLLRRRIVFRLVEADLASRGEQPGDACVVASTTKVADSLGAGDRARGQALLASFPAAYRDELMRWNAQLLELQSHLTGLPCDDATAARQYFDQHTAQFGGRAFDDAKADAAKGVQAVTGQAFTAWLDTEFATVSITVDAAYGTWDATSGTIKPAGGAAAN
ncbi:MAG: hypothetical protein QOJ67_315 [Acidimicrobiaceae bacterium]